MPRLERRWRDGLSSRIATISVPFASYGVAGPAVMDEPGLARLPVLRPGLGGANEGRRTMGLLIVEENHLTEGWGAEQCRGRNTG